jgi:hypothetical protein
MKTCWFILVNLWNWECHITCCCVTGQLSYYPGLFFSLRIISSFLPVRCWDLVTVTLDYQFLQFRHGKINSKENRASDWKINNYISIENVHFLPLNYLQLSLYSYRNISPLSDFDTVLVLHKRVLRHLPRSLPSRLSTPTHPIIIC